MMWTWWICFIQGDKERGVSASFNEACFIWSYFNLTMQIRNDEVSCTVHAALIMNVGLLFINIKALCFLSFFQFSLMTFISTFNYLRHTQTVTGILLLTACKTSWTLFTTQFYKCGVNIWKLFDFLLFVLITLRNETVIKSFHALISFWSLFSLLCFHLLSLSRSLFLLLSVTSFIITGRSVNS